MSDLFASDGATHEERRESIYTVSSWCSARNLNFDKVVGALFIATQIFGRFHLAIVRTTGSSWKKWHILPNSQRRFATPLRESCFRRRLKVWYRKWGNKASAIVACWQQVQNGVLRANYLFVDIGGYVDFDSVRFKHSRQQFSPFLSRSRGRLPHGIMRLMSWPYSRGNAFYRIYQIEVRFDETAHHRCERAFAMFEGLSLRAVVGGMEATAFHVRENWADAVTAVDDGQNEVSCPWHIAAWAS